jgi:hypothetical protein
MAIDTIPSVTHRVVSADFFTPSYRIVGKMMVPNTGIMGLVNDQSAAYMEILDARMARAHMPSKLVDHYEVIRIVKSQIFAISMARREDLGAQTAARGGYVRMTEFPLRITTPVYELDGTLEWAGRFEFSSIMVEGTHDFIPMYNTVITAILLPALRVESPAVLFNRKQVDILALKNQRLED